MSKDFCGERQGFYTVQTEYIMVYQKSLGAHNSQHVDNQCLRILNENTLCSTRVFALLFYWELSVETLPSFLTVKSCLSVWAVGCESELSSPMGMAKKERIRCKNVKSMGLDKTGVEGK